MGIGSGTTAELATDTTLQNEVDRQTFNTVDSATSQEVTFTGFWNTDQANGKTISEVALLNNTTANTGSAFVRNTFDGVDKTSTLELSIDIVVKFN